MISRSKCNQIEQEVTEKTKVLAIRVATKNTKTDKQAKELPSNCSCLFVFFVVTQTPFSLLPPVQILFVSVNPFSAAPLIPPAFPTAFRA
jgi:hypothetical protein